MTKLHYHMLTAIQYGNLMSDDRKTSVGAMVARGYKQISLGTNRAILPVEDFWASSKHSRIIHAEVDVITNFLLLQQPVEPLKNLQMFVTLEPCVECAKFIIYTRRYTNIDKVYVHTPRPNGSGVELLREAGIQVEFITGDLCDDE